ncbi:transferase hexapeptide (six repeat-containing protein) [Pseudomonas sp. ok272]|nr:transferase hexapeptide (six repeat-containing protein) [Pseudomonas sp. ok272]SFM70343.1 transferase hexapeptide (six repeat-containing protein) [Pseudomonas sp. ok602]
MEYMDWENLKRFWRIEVMGGEHKPLKLKKMLHRIRLKEQEHYLFWFRLAQHFYRRPKGLLNYPKLARRIHARLVRTHGIDIMLAAEIGPGLNFAHRVGIVIADAARIGDNLFIRQNTTIGVRATGQKGLIYIGNNVELGANVCIIGDDLRIGDNVTVGAMAFINKDIPDNSSCYTRHVTMINPK